jgi:uracil-DNA glycosylase family 4
LQTEIAACRDCSTLRPWRKFAPEASGTPGTGYLLVGEAPGFVSWRNKRRFTGPAGLLIRRALAAARHPRYRDLEDLFYMTDVVKCHPASPRSAANRTPRRAEIQACAGYLAREIELLRPSVIVCFGKLAAQSVARALAAGGRPSARAPEVIAFPHPSPRNRVTIRKSYATMQALETAITAEFRRLIREREASNVKRETEIAGEIRFTRYE